MRYLSAWIHEMRFGIRHLIKRPAFLIPVILTLALGIGATTTIFTVLDAVILRPLPYPAPERLVRLQSPVPGVGADAVWGLSKGEFLYFQDNSRTFQNLGLYVISRATLGGTRGQAGQSYFAEVSPGMLAVLGTRLKLGRPPTLKDCRQEKPAAIWLSDDFWRRNHGGDPAVVGRTVLLDGRPVQVAGVLERGVRLPEEEQFSEIRVDAWTPLWLDPAQPAVPSHRFRALGRLLPGVSLAAARAELARLTARLPEALPGAYTWKFLRDTGFATELVPLQDDVLGSHRRVLWILFGSVLLLLLIACANAANLLLAHGEANRCDVAVLTALGASRRRLAVHFLAEAFLILLAAGALGTFLAFAGVQTLVRLAPADLPRLPDVRFGWNGVAFTAFVSFAITLTFGLLPLLRRNLPAGAFGTAGRRVTTSRRHSLVRGAIVVAQFALSVLLLSSAALLVQSFRNLAAVQSGLDERGVLTFRIVLPGGGRYQSDEAVRSFYRDFAARVRALPGVSDTGFATALPLTGYDGCTAFFPGDHPLAAGGEPPCVPVFLVSQGYFRTLGIPVPERLKGWEDPVRQGAPAIASRALAERFWPRENALGKSLREGGSKSSFQVAGIAGDVRANGLDRPPVEALYLPLTMDPPRDVAVVVRSGSGTPERLALEIRRELTALDAQVAITGVRSMAGIIAGSKARVTFSTLLLGIASALALALTAIGTYSLLAFLVCLRRSEIGVRMALGAQRRQVGQLVLVQSLRLAGTGLLLGLGAALLTTRSLQSLLFEVSPADAATLTFVLVTLLALAALASWSPAYRATRVSPSEALRYE